MSLPALLEPEPGPRTLIEKPWAGSRLGRLRGAAGRAIGESWEFSTLPGAESASLGRPLHERLGRRLAFLAKLIDTRQPLSVQVHPPPEPSGDWRGKEEAWVVLDAEPRAAVHAGLAPGVDREELARRVREARAGGASAAVLAALRRIPVERGSVVLIPSATVHAIGGGILLAEIQQPADRTLRLFDWGSARELQVEEALAAIDPQATAQVCQPGAPATWLRGRHLELRILGPGRADLDLDCDALLVGVCGISALRAADETQLIEPGALRLFTGGRLGIEVAPDGLAVVGRALV